MAATNNNQMGNIGAASSSSGIMGSSVPQQSQTLQSTGGHMQPQFQPLLQSQVQAHLAGAQNQALAHAHAQAQPQFKFQAQSLSQNQGHGHFAGSSSTPGTAASAKKGQQKPPVRPPTQPGNINVGNALPFKAAELNPAAAAAARRRKNKLPEKQQPDRVAALLPESALYTQLQEFESRVDSSLFRKKIDIQEALKNPPTLQQTLRIYIFNTFSNQNRLIPEKQPAEPPSWCLKIMGRILEAGADLEPPSDGTSNQNSSTFPKFSSFLKRLTVNLDPALYPQNHTIVWEQARSPAPQEGFEIKRKGDKEFTANIRLEMNYTPEKFKLSPALTEVLGIEVDTRPRIVAALWHYVKARKLHSPTEPSVFLCDPALKKVFGEDRLRFSMVSHKLSQHLSPPQPIKVEHMIKLSGNSPAGNTCYDVQVDVPFPLQKELAVFLSNTDKHKEIDACEEAICSAIKKIQEHRRRRAFFLGFSQSPVEFINSLIASQSRDLKLVAGESSRSVENERHSDFYNQPWVEDAVIRYLNRKPATGNEAPGGT